MALAKSPNDRQIITAISELERKVNQKGLITLVPGAMETIVYDPRVYHNSDIIMIPKTLDAKTYDAATVVTAVSDGSFTVSHSVRSSLTRTYAFVIF